MVEPGCHAKCVQHISIDRGHCAYLFSVHHHWVPQGLHCPLRGREDQEECTVFLMKVFTGFFNLKATCLDLIENCFSERLFSGLDSICFSQLKNSEMLYRGEEQLLSQIKFLWWQTLQKNIVPVLPTLWLFIPSTIFNYRVKVM